MCLSQLVTADGAPVAWDSVVRSAREAQEAKTNLKEKHSAAAAPDAANLQEEASSPSNSPAVASFQASMRELEAAWRKAFANVRIARQGQSLAQTSLPGRPFLRVCFAEEPLGRACRRLRARLTPKSCPSSSPSLSRMKWKRFSRSRSQTSESPVRPRLSFARRGVA